MKKLLAAIGIVGASATPNTIHAQAAAAIGTPTCALGALELAKAPNGEDLLAQQASLTDQKKKLTGELTDLPADDTTGRKKLEDKIELNRIALSYVQRSLASYASRQSNIAECESALKRWTLVEQIVAPQDNVTDRQIALDAEATSVTEKLVAAKKDNDELAKAAPSVMAYTKLSLSGADIVAEPDQRLGRQADVSGDETIKTKAAACASMIATPKASLDISSCGSAAKTRSARSYSGGDVAFPSSVLKPRGITANLTGSSSDGTVSIAYADSFNFRRTPKNLPSDLDRRVQLPWEFGYSFGVKAKDGVLFNRDDIDTSVKDKIDGKAAVSAGLFFNVYEGETLKEWNARAAGLKDAAIKACRKEQADGASKAPSTCTGQSLTNWVYAVNPEGGAQLHPEIAKQADDLYFRSKDDKPVWGGGVNASVSRSNYNYLDPDTFIAAPKTKPQPEGGWNYELTAFVYARLNSTSSKGDVSLIGSVSRNSVFGYSEGTKTMQFCPVAIVDKPFVTGGCPSYYEAAPKRIVSWTPAAEVRFITPRFGSLPSLGISPKLSYESIHWSKADRWKIAVPILAFVDMEAGLGVGVEYSRDWGGFSDTANIDGTFNELEKEDNLKIVVTKTFSLTGL